MTETRFTATITLPGVFVEYMRGTNLWDELDPWDTAANELGAALRSAPRRKVGKGYNVTVTVSREALCVVKDYALDLTDTYGADYDSSWPQAGRKVLERARAALAAMVESPAPGE